MDFLHHIIEDPAYRHVVLNHIPVTGLLVAAIVLFAGVILRQRNLCLMGLALVAGTAGATLIVMPAGEEAYPMVYDTLGGPARELLDRHADLAGKWGYLLIANAALAALAFGLALLRPKTTTLASGLVALTTLVSLGSAFVIAEAGGRIRHPEFATFVRQNPDAKVVGGPVAMRRLTTAQLARSVHEVFGEDIEVMGRFDPEVRHAGLLAVGSGRQTVSPAGFEQNEALATSIAEQILTEEKRSRILPCGPASETAADAECTAAMVRQVGEQLFRRPLSEQEVQVRVDAATQSATEMTDFNAGLELALASLLVAPDFLFRIERTEADPSDPAQQRLTNDTWATRASFLLWDAPPDTEFRQAAASGALADPAERARQVDRLLASERSQDGVRAFFADLLRFEDLLSTPKDPVRYTFWNQQIADDAREQTLRIIADHLLTRDLPYPGLFTTRRSYLTRSLGPIYAVPVRSARGWEDTEFPPGHIRTGLLSNASFHILHSHPGRSSPTLRGQFIREALLCQTVPPAPADVEFALFNDDLNQKLRTARERLAVHAANGSCRSCHQMTDPIGLGLESFDGIGRYRTRENDAVIDASGDLDGVRFADHIELATAFSQHPKLGPCLVENLYRYAVGREQVETEEALLFRLSRDFAEEGYRIRPLLRAIVLSDGFTTAPSANPLANIQQATSGPLPGGDA